MASLRLDKFISNQKGLSRSECRKFILRGAVMVDGKTVRVADTKIDPELNSVTIFGEEIGYKEHIYIMMNKPEGLVCANSDKGNKTVIDIIPEELKRKNLFTVGRLDKNTTGLLLITDDGDFAHRVISPKTETMKKYIAVLDGDVTDDMIFKFKEGTTLADGTKCLPAKLIKTNEPNVAEVYIVEGKYHQVKRMFGIVGLGVDKLKRLSIGNLELDSNLREGECRELKSEELCKINKFNNKNPQL